MLQVAAYCRVSTDKEDQANSLKRSSGISASTSSASRIGSCKASMLTKDFPAHRPTSAWSSIKCSMRRSWDRST